MYSYAWEPILAIKLVQNLNSLQFATKSLEILPPKPKRSLLWQDVPADF
jgi:hypothetical protein